MDLVDKEAFQRACDATGATGLNSTEVFVAKDIGHANSVLMIENDIADFARAGDLLVSFRFPSLLAIFDGTTGKRKWALQGVTEHQWGASITSRNTLLVYDTRPSLKVSRVVEIDFMTKAVLREHVLEDSTGLETWMGGYATEMPNGNWLVSTGNQGTAFEISPADEFKWKLNLNYRRGYFEGRKYFLRLDRYPDSALGKKG